MHVHNSFICKSMYKNERKVENVGENSVQSELIFFSRSFMQFEIWADAVKSIRCAPTGSQKTNEHRALSLKIRIFRKIPLK